jgi:type IV pilus biogenesis protein CpaD/CtpE
MKKTLLTVAIATSLMGCVTTDPVVKKTSLELQSIQAKSFDADKTTTFRSVLSVLQDLGYVVGSASMETGFITAESPTQQDRSGGAVFAALLGGVRTEGKTAVTASIEEFGKDTRVRLNFVDKRARSGSYGQRASDETPILDPKVYSNAFEKISESIFIRKAQK